MEIKGYSDLWKAIIRPPRNDDYEDEELAPPEFQLKGRRFKRTDIDLTNERDLTIKWTHYEPVDSQRPCKELPWVIYLHGNASSRVEAMPSVKLLLPEDITVFTLDFAGSGKSDGEYISLGWFERDDVSTVIEYLRGLGSVATIGLWGRSMGAVTALLHSDRDPSIAGIVCDSAFSDLKKLSTQLAKKYTKMPGFVVSMGTKFIAKSVKDRAKFQLNKVKPIDHVDKAFVPILFGHAKDDDFILPSHSEELHDKYSGDKNYISFDGDHNSARPQFFDDSVVIFFINCLQVQMIVPQEKKEFEKPASSVPDFEVANGFAFDDDMNQLYNGGFGQDVSEEEMLRLAMEESLKLSEMDTNPAEA